MQLRGATTEDSAGIAKAQVDGYRSAFAGIFAPDCLEVFTYKEQEKEWRNGMADNPEDVIYVAESDKGGINRLCASEAR